MFGIKKEIETIKGLKKQQEINVERNKDEYSVGIRNGIEICLSVLEGREPELMFIEKEPEIVEIKKNKGRTFSGFIKKEV